MRTPLSWLAVRASLGRSSLRWAAGIALLASVLIIVTGAIVRVTGSGLGCDTWPNCTSETLAPTAELGLHGVIEFGNRLLTVVLCAIVGWLIVTARLQRDPAPGVARWAWVQFWVIVLNAIVGGITVWARLSPYIVAAHFLAATLLLAAATITWHKVTSLDHTDQQVLPVAGVARLGTALLTTTAILIVLGTLVTGTGPHAGDSSEVPRMPFDWNTVTWVHGLTAAIVTVLGVVLWWRTRSPAPPIAHRRVTLFLVVLAGQGLIGLIQVATSLPEVVIVLHMLGSALVWIGAIWLFLDSCSHPLEKG